MTVNRYRWRCALTALIAFSTTAAVAQTPAESTDTGPSTLAVALRSLPADANLGASTLLTVGAGGVKPRAAGDIPPIDEATTLALVPSDLAPIADRFDQAYATFHDIAVLGPSTMQVLNMPGDIDDGPGSVPLRDAIRTLMASFTEDEWQAAGGAGLSIDALTAAQRRLFDRLICRPMLVASGAIGLPLDEPPDPATTAVLVAHYDSTERTLTAGDVRSATALHAFFTADYGFYDGKERYALVYANHDAAPAGVAYRLSIHDQPSPGPGPLDSVRPTVPNVLKGSDLAWDSKALTKSIDLRGVVHALAEGAQPDWEATVKDVAGIVAASTGLELHVDPHYAGRIVTFKGAPPTHVNAADILQALDFALTATWRKVGQAYILTDDVLGLGTKRYWVHSVVDRYDNASDARVQHEAGDYNALPLYKYVGFLSGDTLPVPQSALDRLEEGTGNDIATSDLPPSVVSVLEGKVDDAVNDSYRVGSMSYPGKPAYASVLKDIDQIGGTGRAHIRLMLHLAIDTRGYGRVQLDDGFTFIPYRYKKPKPAAVPTDRVDIPLNIGTLSGHPLGVIASLDLPAEARRVVDRLAVAGIKQFYCPAFYGGETYFSSLALPSMKPRHADVLAAAIDEGRKHGVDVIALVQVMRWKNGTDTVDDRPLKDLVEEDLTIGGQTARQALANVYATDVHPDSLNDQAELSGVWVSPLDPRAADILTRLIPEIAAVPGLRGIAFVDTAAPGYNKEIGPYDTRIELGYTDEMRLAYLRKNEEDPTDFGVQPIVKLGAMFNGGLCRMFINNLEYDGPNENQEKDEWNDYRKSVNDDLLRKAYHSAELAAPSLPLLIRVDSDNPSLVTWTGFDPDRDAKTTIQTMAIMPYDSLTPSQEGSDSVSAPAPAASPIPAGQPILIDMVTSGADAGAVDKLADALGSH